MHGRLLYRPLGYVRLGDYLTERLGMSLRRCQAILRLERLLAGFPRLARALEAGEVSVSNVEIAAAAATPETEGAWLERARRLPLDTLREAARPAVSSSERAACESAVPAPAASTSAASPIEQDEPGRIVSFNAPAAVLATWHWTLDLVRKVAGQQEPAWRCVEFLAAEFLSGVPDSAGDRPASLDPHSCVSRPGRFDSAPDVSPAPPTSSPDGPVTPPTGVPDPSPGDCQGMSAWLDASAAVREALASIGASADPEVILSGRAAASDGDDECDAWELDARLRRVVRLRQSLAWRQGKLLATFAALRLHRDLGFANFDDWVADRLAMSPRRARYLASLVRRLHDLPLLADAYRRGLVSWCQARLLVRVVQPATQSPWIRYARQVTVRRLEDALVACEVAAAPAHIGAPPLPPDDPLPLPDDPRAAVGGAQSSFPPTRHTSAPCPDPGTNDRAGSDRRSWRRIAFWCPLDVASLWDSAVRSCRAAAGAHLEDWECFLLFVQVLRDTWENQEDPHWRRRYVILERDGWRCKAPGCTSRSGLNAHHITFRSQQGGDDEANLVALCVGHHQQGLHEGHIRCFGQAPDDLWWDLGVRPGREPLTRCFGDRLVSRRPFIRTVPLAGTSKSAGSSR